MFGSNCNCLMHDYPCVRRSQSGLVYSTWLLSLFLPRRGTVPRTTLSLQLYFIRYFLIVCTLRLLVFPSNGLVGSAPVSLHLLDFYWTHLVWQRRNDYEFQQPSHPEHLPLRAFGLRLREMKPRCMASGDWPARPLHAHCCTGKFIPNLQQRHLAPFLFQGISCVISLHVLARIPWLWRKLSPLIHLNTSVPSISEMSGGHAASARGSSLCLHENRVGKQKLCVLWRVAFRCDLLGWWEQLAHPNIMTAARFWGGWSPNRAEWLKTVLLKK